MKRYLIMTLLLALLFTGCNNSNTVIKEADAPVSGSSAKMPRGTTETVNDTVPGISVIVDNKPVIFDIPPFIENGITLVPYRDIAEAVGMEADYNDNTRTVTFEKTEKLMKIPLDPESPYVDGKTHTVILMLGSNIATVDGVEKRLDASAKSVEGMIYVPLRFISEAMDMDVIWSAAGLGVLDGNEGFLISTRLRGSAPLAGEGIFPSIPPKTISVVDNNGNSVSLGMDVTEMQKNFGSPALAWGRGVSAPQMRYEYGDNILNTADIGNAYAEIGCSLGKVTVIEIGPNSGPVLKTGAGIAVGDPLTSIAKMYDVSESYVAEHTSNGHVILMYNGNALADSENDVTHIVDFAVSNGNIEAIAISDIVSIRKLSEGN